MFVPDEPEPPENEPPVEDVTVFPFGSKSSPKSRGLVSTSLGGVPCRFCGVFLVVLGVPTGGGGLGVRGTFGGMPTVGNSELPILLS